jgi:NADH:ubiquinone oxidoreductase subunit 3 (subunit A)
MTNIEYMIWFLAMAVMTPTVLILGTLAAADKLPRRKPTRQSAQPHEAEPVSRESARVEAALSGPGTPHQHRHAA